MRRAVPEVHVQPSFIGFAARSFIALFLCFLVSEGEEFLEKTHRSGRRRQMSVVVEGESKSNQTALLSRACSSGSASAETHDVYRSLAAADVFPAIMATLRRPLLDRILGVSNVANTASNARDFCMLERNILSHVKLALLLSVLSSSFLLQTRLVPESDTESNKYGLPLSILQFVASILVLGAGVWDYLGGCQDLMRQTSFLNAPRYVAPVPLIFLANVPAEHIWPS